jgi:hypothetical protein
VDIPGKGDSAADTDHPDESEDHAEDKQHEGTMAARWSELVSEIRIAALLFAQRWTAGSLYHRMRIVRTILLLASGVCLAGCGQPGAPMPPSLHLPIPVRDLKATRVGEKVTLSWTVPYETTDREAIRKPGKMRVCRILTTQDECGKVVGEVPAQQGSEISRRDHPLQASFTDTLSPDLHAKPLAKAIYTIEALNDSGRGAGFGNRVDVPLVPTLVPPSGVRAEVRADGVHIAISRQLDQSEPPDPKLQYWYQVTRTGVPPAAGAPDLVGEVPALGDESVVDRNAEWEKHYAYTVTPITWVETQPNGKRIYSVPGESATPIEVLTKDVFPPATPTGLQAVYSSGEQKTIDLTWAPNTDADLAGYNVYRWVANGTPQKINSELVKTPTYRDPVAAPGEYTYSVSAVDLRGNESAKSAEATEKAAE